MVMNGFRNYTSFNFDPTNISNLKVWYDAADTSTITASSNVVSTWADKSGNGINLTVTPTAVGPSTNTTTQNGKNVISFNGTSNSLYNASSSLQQNVAGFSVFGVIFSSKGGSAVPQRVWNNFQSTYLNRSGYILRRTTTKSDVPWRRLDADALSIITSTSDPSTTNPILFTISANYTAGNITLRMNSTQEASATTTTGVTSNTAAIQVLGSRWDGTTVTEFLQGWVAEIVAYDKIITTDELNSVESYLKSKWGL